MAKSNKDWLSWLEKLISPPGTFGSVGHVPESGPGQQLQELITLYGLSHVETALWEVAMWRQLLDQSFLVQVSTIRTGNLKPSLTEQWSERPVFYSTNGREGMGQKELTKDMLNNLASTCGQASKAKGFWEEGARRNKGEMIALMHSELSELLEAIRSPSRGQQPSDHCPEMSAEAEECADLFIRLADYCYGWNIDLGKAIIEKMAFNESRPPKHNKQF